MMTQAEWREAAGLLVRHAFQVIGRRKGRRLYLVAITPSGEHTFMTVAEVRQYMGRQGKQ